jgi:hypothetical protein
MPPPPPSFRQIMLFYLAVLAKTAMTSTAKRKKIVFTLANPTVTKVAVGL